MKNSYIIRVFYLLSVLILVVMVENLTTAMALEEIPLYGLYETAIDYAERSGQSQSYKDPFYGVDLSAEFKSPSGRRITWWGFFDGDGKGGQDGNIWKIRFMPDELGTWSFHWRFGDGSLSGDGSFQAVDNDTNPAKPGPLAHDPVIHQWLITADGSRHVFLNMVEMARTEDSKKNLEQTLEELKANGFDVLMIDGAVAARSKPMDDHNPFQWMDKESYVPRLRGWHLQEKGLFKKLYEQNVYLYDWAGFYAGNGWINLHEKSRSLQNKVIKYWFLRTAPYFFYLYNIGFELPEYASVPSWPVERAQFVKELDPWNHLVTAHELHEWSYGNSSVIDFSALQNDGSSDTINSWNSVKTTVKNIIKHKRNWRYFGTLRGKSFHDIALIVWDSPSQPHPHCNECIWNAKGQDPGTEESHRKDLWDGITGGMSYAFYAKDNDTGLTAFRNANNFLKSGIKWWTMSPHDESVISGQAYALANLGVEYIIYSSSGERFVLELPHATYEWRWFDPAKGIFEARETVENTAGHVTFNKPDDKDWVLHIQRIHGQAPGVKPSQP